MPNNYQIWLTHNGGAEKIRLPVLPLQLNIRQGMNNQSVNIQGLGELVIMQDPSAMLVSFSSFFTSKPFPGVQFDELIEPISLVEKLNTWKKSDRPIQFMVTGTEINGYFTIEDFPWYKSGGDIGTIYYSMVLKEYRQTSVRQVAVREEPVVQRVVREEPTAHPTVQKVRMQVAVIAEPAPVRVDNRVPERTHTVVRGDSLYRIARTHLGRGSRWPEIHALNKGIISNPNLIFPGQVLRLPHE